MKKFTFKHGVIITLCVSVLLFILSFILSYHGTLNAANEEYMDLIVTGEYSPSWDIAETYVQSLIPMLCDKGFHPKAFTNKMYKVFKNGIYYWNMVGRDEFNDDGFYTITLDIDFRGMNNYTFEVSRVTDELSDEQKEYINHAVDELIEYGKSNSSIFSEEFTEQDYQDLLDEVKEYGDEWRQKYEAAYGVE